MPQTSRGYPYPSQTDDPNGPLQIQALAQAINNDMAARLTDTGWLDITNINSGYTATGAQYRVKAGVLYRRGVLTKNSGNISDGEQICGLPAAARGTATNYWLAPTTGSSFVRLVQGTDGLITTSVVFGTTNVVVLDSNHLIA